MQWAESILEGKTYFAQEYHHPPGYAFFLAPVLWLSGSNLYAIVSLQSFMIALQALLVFYCSRRLFGRRAAWTAFFLYSICGPVIFYSMKILSETLYTTLILASFLFLFRFFDELKWPDIFLCGLFLGLAMEVRGNATMLFWPTLVAALLVTKTWKARAKVTALLMAGIAIIALPVLIRNVSVSRAWTPVASNWGENFYFGNNPGATGGVPHVAGIRTNIFDQIHDVQKEASKRAGRTLNSLEAQRFWFREGLAFIIEHPIQWLKLEWTKFRRMLQAHLPSGIYSYSIEAKRYHPYLRFTLGYGLIFPLFVLGLLEIPWNKRTALFIAYLGIQISIILLYWPEERYLLPIIPFLMMGAGCIASLTTKTLSSKRKAALCAAALLLCLYVNLRPVLPGGLAAWCSNASSAHFARNEFRESHSMALEALKQDQNSVEAWTNLGSSLYAQGNIQDARKAWLQALRINPSDVMSMRNLAISYEKDDKNTSLIWWERTLKAAIDQQLPDETVIAVRKKVNGN